MPASSLQQGGLGPGPAAQAPGLGAQDCRNLALAALHTGRYDLALAWLDRSQDLVQDTETELSCQLDRLRGVAERGQV